ncbi:efflux RND transporter permease subunit [Paenibacillus sp. HB172176]|uniref:efflux RND transporter permease subunit n=1 Tax=Paenibacillus sp. HB172176 TaxID=2493690 RepID=UPI001F0D3D7B|nr:efflux RND transporter permease subunit [Paenibacillus sp. HB172176]
MIPFVLRNRFAVILLTLFVMGVGIRAATSISNEKFPDVELPTLVMQVQYKSHTAEEVERQITLPIEKAIEKAKPYESLTSQSRENGAVITVSYDFGTDMDKTERLLQSAIVGSGLPQEAEISYKRISADAKPVYSLAMTAENTKELEEKVKEDLAPELQNIEGVNAIELEGTAENQVIIRVNEQEANAYGITLKDIQSAVAQSEYILPLGIMEEEQSSIAVSMEGRVDQLEAIGDIAVPVTSSTAGTTKTTVLLRDIAEIKPVEQVSTLTRYNGQPAIVVEVFRTQEGNTAEVARAVREEVERFNQSYDFSLFTVIDQGKDVEESIHSLLREGGFGALFTVLIVLLFLRNVRATLIAIISLPLSILGTIYVLEAFGYSLNIMTLGGMAVAVGRIVDDSIVVIENIFRWLQKEKAKSKLEVMYQATKEVFGPVMSSTLATVVVFLPLAFVDGLVGEFFRPFSLTVVTSILLSLAVAFLIIPVLAVYMFKGELQEKEDVWLKRGYEKLLAACLRKKVVVILSACSLLVASGIMISMIGKSFLPAEPAHALEVEMELPGAASLAETDKLSQQVEAAMLEQDSVDYVQASIGRRDEAGVLRSNTSADNKATYFVQLTEDVDLEQAKFSLGQLVQEELTSIYPDGMVRINEVQQEGPPSGTSIEVKLYGNRTEALIQAADQVYDVMMANADLKNIVNRTQQLQPKYVVRLTEEAKLLGVQPMAVYQQVNEKLQPVSAGNMTFDGEATEVLMQLDQPLSGKEELENSLILTPQGPMPLKKIATIEQQLTPTAIEHQDGKMAVKLAADSAGEEVGKVSKALERDLSAIDLPSGVEWETGGGQELMSDGFKDLGTAMTIAVALVFVVLTVTFGGLLTPLVILSALIFVPIGSVGALLLAGETLSMSGMIGMLMLIGIVVTNAVVMLDRVEMNRKKRMDLRASILEASATRLRPILMTALATVFALLPLALSDSSSGVISKGLAIAVIGGLTTSTLLTLVFIPVLYSMLGKYRRFAHEEI